MQRFLLALLLTLVAVSGTDRKGISDELDRLRAEYKTLGPRPDVALLVELDGKLRRLIDEPWRKEKKSFDGSVWKEDWSALGVEVSHYGESLFYTGKLLVEAHRIAPSGEGRRFTLFSTILGEQGASGLGEMPSVENAKQYLSEFPDGPFADETAIILGNFYNDLFKVLTGLQTGKELAYKFDCFSKYVLKGDLEPQAEKARRLSLDYYTQALDLLSDREAGWATTRDVENFRQSMEERRPVGWHFCTD